MGGRWLAITPGQRGDAPAAIGLLSQAQPSRTLAADTAYDSDALRHVLARRGTMPVIPNNPTRTRHHPFDPHAYKRRNVVEREDRGPEPSVSDDVRPGFSDEVGVPPSSDRALEQRLQLGPCPGIALVPRGDIVSKTIFIGNVGPLSLRDVAHVQGEQEELAQRRYVTLDSLVGQPLLTARVGTADEACKADVPVFRRPALDGGDLAHRGQERRDVGPSVGVDRQVPALSIKRRIVPRSRPIT